MSSSARSTASGTGGDAGATTGRIRGIAPPSEATLSGLTADGTEYVRDQT